MPTIDRYAGEVAPSHRLNLTAPPVEPLVTRTRAGEWLAWFGTLSMGGGSAALLLSKTSLRGTLDGATPDAVHEATAQRNLVRQVGVGAAVLGGVLLAIGLYWVYADEDADTSSEIATPSAIVQGQLERVSVELLQEA